MFTGSAAFAQAIATRITRYPSSNALLTRPARSPGPFSNGSQPCCTTGRGGTEPGNPVTPPPPPAVY